MDSLCDFPRHAHAMQVLKNFLAHDYHVALYPGNSELDCPDAATAVDGMKHSVKRP